MIFSLLTAFAGDLHPTFPLLDAKGQEVLQSGAPYAPMQTCGTCHDTTYIASHSAHATVGADRLVPAGSVPGGRPFETGPGRFGRWNPEVYDVASTDDPARWARTYGLDHAGGGPVAELGIQMDCMLCHLAQADDTARREALTDGRFHLVNTATLAGTDLVAIADDGVSWNPEAFDDGRWPIDRLPLQDPTSERCGSCHGAVHRDREPLDHPAGLRTRTTGLVYAGQRIDQSALNLEDKEAAARSWDVHAERLLECANCHYSVNNPVFRQEWATSRPDHLRFDARKMSMGAYLRRPSHEFAKGSAVAHDTRPELKNSMRSCNGCHDPDVGHDWLPDRQRHFGELACTSCHVPEVHWTAREQLDWTALDADGQPLSVWRGAEGPPEDPRTLHAGYTPLLLPRMDADGTSKLAPFNVTSVFYWASDGVPVARDVLEDVWSDVPALLDIFDTDEDGQLSDAERRLDTPAKTEAVRAALEARGVEHPEILGELEPHPLNHGVTRGRFVTRECTACHGEASRVYGTAEVARWLPGATLPTPRHADTVRISADDLVVEDGRLLLRPRARDASTYIFGADRVPLIDWLGLLGMFGAFAFAFGHGGLRWWTSRDRSDR